MSQRSFLLGHRWLIIRRVVQAGFVAVFLAGPLTGAWLVKGTLASSMTLNVLPLTDPFLLLQTLATGHWPAANALVGGVLVAMAYAAIGGRVFCSWVCPVNPLTDLAAWLRHRLGLSERIRLDRRARLLVMAAVLLSALVTGTVVWESYNPVTMLHRGLVFGTLWAGGWTLAVVLAVFLLDFTAGRIWCGHLCPVGAFYSILGAKAVVRVVAESRHACNDCGDCYRVCPEPHVLAPALKGAARGLGPVVGSADCTNCARCIDVCPKNVFVFGPPWRGDRSVTSHQGECSP